MIPKVVIVGRPNVGKSSLLNLLAGRRISIVDPTAGVTRDRVGAAVELPPPPEERKGRTHNIELIDTGGYGIDDTLNLTAQVEQQIAFAVAEAHLILFTVDAQTGIVPLDEQIARLLHTESDLGGGRHAVPVLLIANKVDDQSHETGAYEASRLGFGEPQMVSAANGYRKRDLVDAIRSRIDFDAIDSEAAPPDPGVLLAIVGKRNAGKSTLVNALAGDERVIVSEHAGTTRDSVDVRFEVNGQAITAIDTAGVRRKKSIKDDIDFYSHHRALRSVRRADVVVLVIDAIVPVSQVDRQLVDEILRHFKPTVVVVNKWDLAEKESTQEQFMSYFDDALKGLSFAPFVFISAVKSQGLREVIAMAMNLHKQAGHRVSTGELNKVMEQILAERTPTSKTGKYPKIYYVTQLDVHPPTIGLFVNDTRMFEGTYQRFLMNRFRDTLPFSEIPIKLLIRHSKGGKESHEPTE